MLLMRLEGHIPFVLNMKDWETLSKVGVMLYGGSLVDPCGYSSLAALIASHANF
jgi:hypothetical protein